MMINTLHRIVLSDTFSAGCIDLPNELYYVQKSNLADFICKMKNLATNSIVRMEACTNFP